jgi:hypothetical protein
MDQPTEEERLNFVKSYGVEPVEVNTDFTFKDAAKTVAEFTPIIGDAMAAKEIYDELQKEDPDYRFVAILGGAALVGAVPGIGDVAAKGIRKAADTLKRIEVDPDAVGSLGGNVRLKPKETGYDYDTLVNLEEDVAEWARENISNADLRKKLKADYGVTINNKRISPKANEDTLEFVMPDGNIFTGTDTIPKLKRTIKEGVPTVEAAGLTDEAIEKWRKENATSDEFRKALKGRNPELQEAAAGVKEGRVFNTTYRKLADELRPIRKVTEVPKPATTKEVVSALDAGKRKSPIVDLNYTILDGEEITARLDINAYTDYDVWVPTIKHAGKTMYKPTVVLEDVKFIQPEAREVGKAMDVAVGPERLEADFGVNPKKGNKAPFAVMTGKYVEATDNDAYKLAQEAFNNPEFTQVGYDPTRRGFFYDRETGEAILSADTVIQVGHLALARNAKKMDAEAFPFNKGGMAMEEQMNMNFGDVPDNTIGQDPVSGNDIPLGASAENVRDDIPANLSEGEIVVAADVVNFHGVKLFEDLRAEAKMGYAQMDQDGRMGGEPMDDMGMDIELSELDLEVMDDEAPVEMARGGMNVERGRGNMYSSYSAPKAKPTRDRSMSAVVSRAQANKNKPKNRFEALRERIRDIFDDDDRRVTLDKKPPKSDPIRPSIAQQINFGGDYKDKEPTKAEPKKRRSSVRGAGDVTQAYRGENEPLNVRYYDQPFYKRLMEGLGYDEGGLVDDEVGINPPEQPHLIGGEDQFNQPFYAPDQKGGFDMENAYANYGDGTGGGPLLEMREYMNDEGHRIFITFIDGVPQMEIPAGYYPVGDDTVVAPEVPPVGGSGGSDSGGSGGGGMDITTPDPVNYKELTMEELTKMVEDQKTLGSKIIGNLNPFVKIAMWDSTRRVKAELQRRRDDIYTSEVDKRRYDQLLEISNAEEPGLIATLLGKITGNDPNAPEVRTPAQTDALYTQLDKMTKAYTPSDQEASNMTSRGFTPGVDDAISPAKPAATTTPVIPEQGTDADAFDKMQDRFDIERIEADMKAQPRPAPRTATKPIREESPRVQQVRKNTQKVMKDMRDRGASREERNASLQAAARTENVVRDLDRGVVRGFEKGGLASKKSKKKKSK